MDKWYRIVSWSTDINEFDVVKVTDKTITYIERNWNGVTAEHRQNRNSSHGMWFPSRDDAVQFLRDRLKRSIKYHEDQIVAERNKLEKLS